VAGETVIAFSSGARPLYARNVLEALAKPSGHLQLLRYSKDWLPEDTAKRWGPALEGKSARLHFVLQHPDDYFDPVLFPFRAGTVKRAYTEGSSHFLELRLTDDVSLIDPNDPKPNAKFAEVLRAYREAFAGLPQPKEFYAAVVKTDALPPCLYRGADLELFERNTELLANAEPFGLARFIKVLRVVRHHDGKTIPFDCALDSYVVEPDIDYRVELLSFQPKGMQVEETFTARVDGAGISLLGRTLLRLASRYDQLSITFRTSLSNGVGESPATVHIEPHEEIYGPHLELPFVVKRRQGDVTKDALLGTFAVSLIAAPGPLATWKPWVAGVVFLVAVAVAFLVQYLRGISVASFASFATASGKAIGAGGGPPGDPRGQPRQASGDEIRPV
jgi:hypothetical protein